MTPTKIINKMKRIEFNIGDNIEKIYEKLQENAPCFGVLNGEKIYSKYTLDEVYLKITGMNKKYNEKSRKKLLEESEFLFYKKLCYNLKEYKNRIPDIIEYCKKRGRGIIKKEYIQVWDNFVPVEIKRYNGFEVFFLLDIIEVLNNEEKSRDERINECVSMFDEKCKCETSKETILNWLEYFHPSGIVLVEKMRK